MANVKDSMIRSGIILFAVMLLTMFGCEAKAQNRSVDVYRYGGALDRYRSPKSNYFVQDAQGNRWWVNESRATGTVSINPMWPNAAPSPWGVQASPGYIAPVQPMPGRIYQRVPLPAIRSR